MQGRCLGAAFKSFVRLGSAGILERRNGMKGKSIHHFQVRWVPTSYLAFLDFVNHYPSDIRIWPFFAKNMDTAKCRRSIIPWCVNK